MPRRPLRLAPANRENPRIQPRTRMGKDHQKARRMLPAFPLAAQASSIRAAAFQQLLHLAERAPAAETGPAPPCRGAPATAGLPASTRKASAVPPPAAPTESTAARPSASASGKSMPRTAGRAAAVALRSSGWVWAARVRRRSPGASGRRTAFASSLAQTFSSSRRTCPVCCKVLRRPWAQSPPGPSLEDRRPRSCPGARGPCWAWAGRVPEV
mmetsp:Transcript_124421/g.398467  ORF Transcript_124421/g.398467 Transcript_124421/m.398467 type:complete len:213 (+) Transcript_124421:639-1277(+)